MKETIAPAVGDNMPENQEGPQGIGMAVAFDWGLAVQVFVTPIISTFFGQKTTGLTFIPGIAGTILFFLLSWLVAVGLVLFGEMVRSGRNRARLIQLGANILLTLAGLFSIVGYYQSISAGHLWPIVTAVILLIFSPLIAWRLSRPVTARWFRRVTPTEGRQRHSGRWVWFIALWAIVGGLLQTIAAMK